MKKAVLFALVFMVPVIFFSQSINVTTPDSLDYWDIGKTYEIEWNINGNMDATVKINIFKDSISQSNFVGQLTGPNSGKMMWTIPGSYTQGIYILRIKTADNQVVGDSAPFHIQDRRLIRIDLISPAGGQKYQAPGTMLFKWTMENEHLVEHVRLILKKGGVKQDETVVDNNGSVTGPLTDGVNDGTDYSVRIEDADDASIFDESGHFEIYHAAAPSLHIKKPDKAEYGLGEPMNIEWAYSGFDGDVNIDLMKNNTMFRNVVNTVTGGSFNWLVNSVPVGEYRIRIYSNSNSGISDMSREFRILTSTDLLVFSKRGIFEREGFLKGQNTTLRFRVSNPSDQAVPVSVRAGFYKGTINRLSGNVRNRLFIRASTGYRGNSGATVAAGGDTLFDLPVTVTDGPGDYTVIITVLPSDSSDITDANPGNNTIYGYYKVYLKALQMKRIK